MCLRGALFAIVAALMIDPALADDSSDCFTLTYLKPEATDQVISACTKLISSGSLDAPKTKVAYNERGVAYLRKNQNELALQDFNQAIQLLATLPRTTTDRSPYNNRGIIYSRQRQFDRAVADFDEAIRRDPEFDNAYYNRGLAHSRQGNDVAAIADFTRALEPQPNIHGRRKAYFYFNRYAAHARLRNFDRAIADYKEALLIDADAAKTLDADLPETASIVVKPFDAPDPKYDMVRVLFGTDREQTTGVKRISFSAIPAKKLILGHATVTIPKNDARISRIDRPWSLKIAGLELMTGKEDPNTHFTIHEIAVLSREEFSETARVQPYTTTMQSRDHAFVFVHGYNMTFDNALYRVAQIAHDLNFHGGAFLYSWPSNGHILHYSGDRTSAAAAVPYLRDFLELVMAHSPARHVHLMAHSLGNDPLLNALSGLDAKYRSPASKRIDQIVLHAPDVKTKDFEELANKFKGLAQNITLYASSTDKALVGANVFGGTRAGQVLKTGPAVILPEIDTIDVSATSSDFLGLNHSMYAKNPVLLNDVALLFFKGEHPPDVRVPIMRRETRGSDGAIYWLYPKGL